MLRRRTKALVVNLDLKEVITPELEPAASCDIKVGSRRNHTCWRA
jgi:hypothetical protein